MASSRPHMLRRAGVVLAACAAVAVAASLAGGDGSPGWGDAPSPAGGDRPGSRAPDGDRSGARAPLAAREPRTAAPAPRATLVTNGPRDARRVALTFDADMTRPQLAQIRSGSASSPWYDERIVDLLEETRTPATIFLADLWAKAHPEPARRLARSPPFQLENHSLSHVAFKAPCFGLETIDSAERKRAEVVESSEAIERATGKRPRHFRYPGGCHSRDDLRLVAGAGEQPLGWDVVSGDVGQSDAKAVAREVLEEAKPGSIVVLHLVGAPNAPATAKALREIIPGAAGSRL
jgi:peptidoglycan/xylan/chitin deacetylase (PgdA/CDA1 family)